MKSVARATISSAPTDVLSCGTEVNHCGCMDGGYISESHSPWTKQRARNQSHMIFFTVYTYVYSSLPNFTIVTSTIFSRVDSTM